MRRSLEAETQSFFAFLMAVYEKTLTPHQTIKMHGRAQPWWADIDAIIKVLGECRAGSAHARVLDPSHGSLSRPPPAARAAGCPVRPCAIMSR